MSIARRTASQLLPQRSVHLRIVPRPSNLSESREIFRVMQRFGEISTYKNLRVCSTPLAAVSDACTRSIGQYESDCWLMPWLCLV